MNGPCNLLFTFLLPGTTGELKVAVACFFTGILVWFSLSADILAVDTIGCAECWLFEGIHDGAFPGLNIRVVVALHYVLLTFFD